MEDGPNFCGLPRISEFYILPYIEFIHSEKATQFCEISNLDLTMCSTVKSKFRDFAKFCILLRLYELYITAKLLLKSRRIPD